MRTVDRFWSHVEFALDGSGCLLWRSGTNSQGYGAFRLDGRNVQAHRWAWEEWNGPIPDGLVIDHLCRTPLCVNPDHLEPVTLVENTRRGEGVSARNARKTHCPHGHKLVPTVSSGGKRRRYCPTCSRAQKRAYKKRNPERRRQERAEWYARVGPGYYRDWKRRRKAITIVAPPGTPFEEVQRLKALALKVYRDLERDLGMVA